jgi:excinuclease ABC subunit C
LDGRDDSPLADIEQAMVRAAQNLHFEQATVLREDLRAITWLSRRVGDIAQARERYTFIYPVDSDSGGEPASACSARSVWYLIRRGLVEGAVAAPTTPAQLRQTNGLIKKWLAHDNCVGTSFVARPETLALVASWFRNNRSELKKTFLPGKKGELTARHKSPAQPEEAVPDIAQSLF